MNLASRRDLARAELQRAQDRRDSRSIHHARKALMDANHAQMKAATATEPTLLDRLTRWMGGGR